MNLLITGADRPLGRLAAAHLRDKHQLRLSGIEGNEQADVQYEGCDLRTPDQVAPLVKDVQAILHLANYDPAVLTGPEADAERLDHATRGTYVLLDEARQAGVERVILASTLQLFETYPADHVIDEQWQPQPHARAESLAPFLGEMVCREFAREGGIVSICLRFGHLNKAEGTDQADALRALENALVLPTEKRGYRWHLFHVYSGKQFSMDSARHSLKLSEVEDT